MFHLSTFHVVNWELGEPGFFTSSEGPWEQLQRPSCPPQAQARSSTQGPMVLALPTGRSVASVVTWEDSQIQGACKPSNPILIL